MPRWMSFEAYCDAIDVTPPGAKHHERVVGDRHACVRIALPMRLVDAYIDFLAWWHGWRAE